LDAGVEAKGQTIKKNKNISNLTCFRFLNILYLGSECIGTYSNKMNKD